MAAAGHPGEDAALYDAVCTVGMELCPELGIAIPVGKDSMSMRTVWDGGAKRAVSPVSLIVSAFAPVSDARRAFTPELATDAGETALVLIDLGRGRNRLGASVLAQVYEQLGDEPADLDDATRLSSLAKAIAALRRTNAVLAYHDRSDGGLFATICEMAFAGSTGVTVRLDDLGSDPLAALFSEELGVVLQVRRDALAGVLDLLEQHGLAAGAGNYCHVVGALRKDDRIVFEHSGREVLSDARVRYRLAWSETSHAMQALRDNPACARQEYERLREPDHRGLLARVTFDPNEAVAGPLIARAGAVEERPRVAILREQGVNGQVEMAAAFTRAGFTAVDVHMSDVLSGRTSLTNFRGAVACGGFSYGDVLGAGQGWAKTILFNGRAREQFTEFFKRADTFALGVCNGCQMMSALKELIPGAQDWPRFVRNESEQFEARLSLIEIQPSPSILLRDMVGSRLPIAVAHGEGRAVFAGSGLETCERAGLVSARYVDNSGEVTERYPENPNGSPRGITALTAAGGRVTIMMPHPERVFRTVQLSWHPPEWGEASPWFRMFANARRWVG
jgi:phosphoribosylformylglycinamidine synthase